MGREREGGREGGQKERCLEGKGVWKREGQTDMAKLTLGWTGLGVVERMLRRHVAQAVCERCVMFLRSHRGVEGSSSWSAHMAFSFAARLHEVAEASAICLPLYRQEIHAHSRML